MPIRCLKVSRVATSHSSDECSQMLWTAPASRIVTAFLGVITEIMSHTVLLPVVALSQRRPRAHILRACGTQRGGANSDALAKFQFRDVGLLAILIGNVHCFPFSLLASMQTNLVCFFAPVPSLLRCWCILYGPSSCLTPIVQELRID